MIETIINTPKVLLTNSSPLTYDGISALTRCTPCCNGGWLSYQNGSPIFKILGNNYTGYYDAVFTGTISSAVAGTVALGLYEDGVLLPDTVRSVTVDADGLGTIAIVKSLKLCPKGMTSISIQSVPSVVTPSDPTTPIETEAPIVVSGTFRIDRDNG